MTLSDLPGARSETVAGDVTVHPAGARRSTFTWLRVVVPVLVTVAVVVVWVPVCSVGWLCVPATVLTVCRATVGLPECPSVILASRPSIVTVWVAAS